MDAYDAAQTDKEMLRRLTEPSFTLVDDGTMDTVIACDNCGKETRFNYNPGPFDEDQSEDEGKAYEDLIEWCFEELKNDHECEEEE